MDQKKLIKKELIYSLEEKKKLKGYNNNFNFYTVKKGKLPVINLMLFFLYYIKNFKFIILFLFFLVFSFLIITLKLLKKSVIKNEIKREPIKKIKSNYTREEALTKGKIYLNKCLQRLLFNHQNFLISDNPKITVIIPIYNGEKIIKSSIRSIQNQNMTDIEIIIINDFSEDNTSKIIEELKKEDPRIKLINNDKNMGTLYSRSIAVLQAKGKYILAFDHDDFFFDEGLFDALYDEAEEGNFDIVSFMDLEIYNYNVNITDMYDGPCTHHPDNLVVYQPELQYFCMFKNEKFEYIDVQIWGKIFKTEIYKKSVEILGKERYSTYNTFNEDIVGLFAICNVAKSYKYMRRYGLFHLVGHYSSSRRVSHEHSIKMKIFFSDIIFDLSKDKYKKYAIFMLVGMYSISDANKEYLRTVLKKIMNCKFIEDRYKQSLIRFNYI